MAVCGNRREEVAEDMMVRQAVRQQNAQLAEMSCSGSRVKPLPHAADRRCRSARGSLYVFLDGPMIEKEMVT